MSTFELQRKLKDDLIEKVYQQCNDQIYKWLIHHFPFFAFYKF